MPDPLAKSQALARARRAFKDGIVIPTKHYQAELAKEGLTDLDVRNAIDRGSIYDEPEPHIKTGNWIYRIEGPSLDGKPIIVPVALQQGKLCLVTVFTKRGT